MALLLLQFGETLVEVRYFLSHVHNRVVDFLQHAADQVETRFIRFIGLSLLERRSLAYVLDLSCQIMGCALGSIKQFFKLQMNP